MNRRDLIKSGLIGLASPAIARPALAKNQPRIVIIGGGFGGATAARTLKLQAPHLDVSLVEPKTHYMACPFSNLVITGARSMKAQSFGYEGLTRLGVRHLKDWAEDVDPARQEIVLGGGARFGYDRLILSPGIDINYQAIEGYSKAASEDLPHGWQAGSQTRMLQQKLRNLPDGELVVLSVPPAPFRCPPGPYERASLIAHYLKTHKLRSKLLILDGQEKFSKQALFEQIWARDYPGIITRRPASDDGAVIAVDAAQHMVMTEFDEIKAGLINPIPPQSAGLIAKRAGVTNRSGWCPVNSLDFSSNLQDNIYVIGDAIIAAPMPKSAFAAGLQARLCALQIIRSFNDVPAQPTILANICYSFLSPEQAVSITGVYQNEGGELTSVNGAGGLSPLLGEDPEGDQEARRREAAHARGWFKRALQQAYG